MLAGLMSRWMMPTRWADSTAPAILMAVSRASPTDRGARRTLISSCGGGQYSMTMKGRPPSETPAP